MARSKKAPSLPLEDRLREASEILAREIGDPSPDLLAWAERSGIIHGKTALRRVLAQQASLELLLITIVEALPREALVNLPIEYVTSQLPYSHLFTNTKARSLFSDTDFILNTLEDNSNLDLLGKLYEILTPQAERRTLGQYWTPQPIVDFMTAWVLDAGPNILEPAVGSGRFIQEIERRNGLEKNVGPVFIKGYEISPLVMLIAIVNSAIKHNEDVKLNLKLESFFNDSDFNEYFDGVVCNPPYTRHHHMSPEQKISLSKIIEKSFGVKLSGFTSIFVYFLLYSLMKVKDGGKLAFITPSELYEASYAEQLKSILKKSAQPDAIVVFDPSHQVFEGVDTAGCITLMRKGGSDDGNTLLVEVKSWPGTEELLKAISERSSNIYLWGATTLLHNHDLTEKSKWSNPRQMLDSDQKTAMANFPQLSEVATIVRGVATGANDYFCLTTEEVNQTKIPFEYFQPVITKTRVIQGYELHSEKMVELDNEGYKVWLFTCYEARERMSQNIVKYVNQGESEGLHLRSLLKLKRGKWYMAEKRLPPPILFTYLSRVGTRFIYNSAGAQALNVFLLIYPKKSIAQDEDNLRAFTALLNSSPVREGLHAVGRSYGGDTVKLEPRELDRLPVIDTASLERLEVLKLSSLLDKLNNDQTQDAQIELDEFVSQIILRINSQDQVQDRKPAMQAMLF